MSDGQFFVSHRLALAQAALAHGFVVAVACPEAPAVEEIRQAGFEHIPIVLSRRSKSAVCELLTMASIFTAIRKFWPDVVHLITAKPVIYGGIIARFCGIPILSSITGLGFVFVHNSWRIVLLRKLVLVGYRLAIAHRRSTLIFQNDGDMAIFRDQGLLAVARHVMIRGSGTDLSSITPAPLPDGPTVVVMPSRLLRDKGVVEFVEAARLLKVRGVNAVFRLLGDPDFANPTSVSLQDLEMWVESGVVEWHRFTRDIGKALASSHIVVLPSYREGFPKTLIDAAAAGRAAVTSNVPGCRDAIIPGVTGILFEPQNALDIARVLEPLILNRSVQARMGIAARIHAEANFDIRTVCDAHISLYKSLKREP